MSLPRNRSGAQYLRFGELVEVRRTPSSDWEQAEYIGKPNAGYYQVILKGKRRRVDATYRVDTSDRKNSFLTRYLTVNSSRIRSVVLKK